MFDRNYEELGSSDKGLILKNSGKIKYQWGNSLIDLIDSNGKISLGFNIKKISDISQANQNGIYILNNESLIIKIEGKAYQVGVEAL